MSSFTEKAREIVETVKEKLTGSKDEFELKAHNETDYELMYGDGRLCGTYNQLGENERGETVNHCPLCEPGNMCQLDYHFEPDYVFESDTKSPQLNEIAWD